MKRANVLRVARWEFLKNLRSPTFLVLTFMMPLIMVLGAGIGFLTEQFTHGQEMNVAVIDQDGSVYSYLDSQLAEDSPLKLTHHVGTREQLEQEVVDGRYSGFVVLSDESLMTGRISFYVDDVKAANPNVLRGHLAGAITSYRLDRLGLDPASVAAASGPIFIEPTSIAGESQPVASFVAPLIAGMVLIFSAIFSGQVLMYGVIKEKRNRIVEILLSSISSLELVMGKILGFGALSALQIFIWVSVGLAVASRLIDLGELGLTPATLAPSITFFVLGYFLLASLFATAGATMKDAEGGSQMQGLVILIPMIPMFAASMILMHPNIVWVRILSHLPPFIPVTMLIRLAATNIAPWEMATTLVALILSSTLFILLGARIFEGAILQYERTVGLKDIRAILRRG